MINLPAWLWEFFLSKEDPRNISAPSAFAALRWILNGTTHGQVCIILRLKTVIQTHSVSIRLLLSVKGFDLINTFIIQISYCAWDIFRWIVVGLCAVSLNSFHRFSLFTWEIWADYLFITLNAALKFPLHKRRADIILSWWGWPNMQFTHILDIPVRNFSSLSS